MQKILTMKNYHDSIQRQKKSYAFVKRAFDIVFSSIMMIAFLPVCLVVAVIAAADTKGSPIFIQTRMGRNNRPFRMLKFRTMSVNAPANVATHKLNHAESYISPVGGMIRRLSLDELPQLINIFKGDMSFIGPRPVVLTETDLLDLRTQNGASAVRPGLTGWAQVNGRDKLTIAEKARLDAYYSRHMSLRVDGKVLLKTVGYVLRSRDVCEGANPTITAKFSRGRSA